MKKTKNLQLIVYIFNSKGLNAFPSDQEQGMDAYQNGYKQKDPQYPMLSLLTKGNSHALLLE